MLKVAILGYGQMLASLISGCKDANCEIVGVFRYDRVRYTPFDLFFLDLFNILPDYNYIKSYNLPEIKARRVNSAEFKKELIKRKVDVVLVGSWGEKFKKPIIDLPKIATINVHPSLLPKYRGPNPYFQAIKHLETQSGVTFHLMDENYDTGAILHQIAVDIKNTDTGIELKDKITQAAKFGVKELLERLEDDIIIPLNQNEKKSSYFSQAAESEATLDFTKTAEELHALVRAFHPWSKCFFKHQNEYFVPNPYKMEIIENKTKLTQAGTIVEKDDKTRSVSILCADNKILKMSDLKLFDTLSQPFTGLYFRHKVKQGQVISD